MVKKFVFSAACLLTIANAPAAAKDGSTQGPTATAQARTDPATTAGRAPPRQTVPNSARLDSIPTTGRAGHRLIGRLDPSDNSMFGVGLWRVAKPDHLDPNRLHPLRDPSGRLSGVAAVGFNFSF